MAQNDSILRFENVSVTFDTVEALKDVSFDLKEGQTRIILGAAGSGKTVLLKTAIALDCPSAGKVILFGQEIQNLREQQLFDIRRRVGILFQEGALFDSMTVERNVAYPLISLRTASESKKNVDRSKDKPAEPTQSIRERIQQALDFVELGQTLKQFPDELSGGMQRRVAIARAVVAQPPLLLYDSPTAGLDPITAHTIVTLIIKERDLDNTTALVVTHRYQDGNLAANFRYNPDNAQLEPDPTAAERTIFMVMREGKLVFEGSQRELEASTDDYVSKFVKRD
ncbi:ABC transporter ATP-binding protein [Nevskia soli]|jgi:phospholipid/cholesterol/gamma-HCH transport system ATP-binding protein|uniref:ABC transporter ATP-binding protein n=1 Tax=Nevskia soli TaxID=418856 RepID=UPI0015D73107|nr:ATP-binding cassette domain-containing protein [Nevskia soli]